MPDAVYIKSLSNFVGIGFFVLRVERSWNLERILILLHNFMCGRFWERDERTEEILVLTINFSHENSKLIFLISGSHLKFATLFLIQSLSVDLKASSIHADANKNTVIRKLSHVLKTFYPMILPNFFRSWSKQI